MRRFLDDGNYVISIFVDLTKAFDTVDHEILLYKLDRYGIRGHANDFFRTYLTNRLQYTVINGTKSALNAVTCGVPQGSVLGPLFFALYRNDIYESVGMDHVRLFADDTALYMWHKNLTTLVEEIKLIFSHLYMWCVRNILIINRDKTNFVLFHTVNKPIPMNFLTIHTEFMSIDRVPFFKYLAVTLDETFTWNNHIDDIGKSLVKYFGIFNQIKNKVTSKLSRELYFAFIYSKIKYAIEVYGNCSSTNMNKMLILQNKLMKMLLKLDRRTSTNYLHKMLNICKVNDIYLCCLLNFVNDVLCGRCPDVFKNYFEFRRNVYDVRRKGQVKIPAARLPFGDKAVRIHGASFWNKLNTSVVPFRLKKCFKKKMKILLISKYS